MGQRSRRSVSPGHAPRPPVMLVSAARLCAFLRSSPLVSRLFSQCDSNASRCNDSRNRSSRKAAEHSTAQHSTGRGTQGPGGGSGNDTQHTGEKAGTDTHRPRLRHSGH